MSEVAEVKSEIDVWIRNMDILCKALKELRGK